MGGGGLRRGNVGEQRIEFGEVSGGDGVGD